MVSYLLVPESPRYLYRVGQTQRAAQILAKFTRQRSSRDDSVTLLRDDQDVATEEGGRDDDYQKSEVPTLDNSGISVTALPSEASSKQEVAKYREKLAMLTGPKFFVPMIALTVIWSAPPLPPFTPRRSPVPVHLGSPLT